jgi:hypothetical protein
MVYGCLLVWCVVIKRREKVFQLYLLTSYNIIVLNLNHHQSAIFGVGHKTLWSISKMIKKYQLFVFICIFNSFNLHSCHCTPESNDTLINSY